MTVYRQAYATQKDIPMYQHPTTARHHARARAHRELERAERALHRAARAYERAHDRYKAAQLALLESRTTQMKEDPCPESSSA